MLTGVFTQPHHLRVEYNKVDTHRGRFSMAKKLAALTLGIISFFLMFAVGEELGIVAAFIFIAVYYLAAQFLLSRGNPNALEQDWPVLLILNTPMILTAITVLLIEPDAKYTAVVVVISTMSSVIGVGLASRLSRH